jgi:hypothetical protein|tara:strand:+ start:150 stop:1379 length:1230 start_codon:yes stop_codon:yes gene_type:complete
MEILIFLKAKTCRGASFSSLLMLLLIAASVFLPLYLGSTLVVLQGRRNRITSFAANVRKASKKQGAALDRVVEHQTIGQELEAVGEQAETPVLQLRPMWKELTSTVEECQELCQLRRGCTQSVWTTNDCQLLSSEVADSFQNKDMSYCSWGVECDCELLPPNTSFFKRSETCAMLSGKIVTFTGDSLIRDQWTAFSLWLLTLDGINVLGKRGFPHAACMINAWKMIDHVQARPILKQHKVLGTDEFYVCGNKTTLRYESRRTFHQIRQSGVPQTDIWVLGSGVHQMVTFGKNEEALHSFINWLNTVQHSSEQILFIGTHHRIIDRAPAPYMEYAKGPQGNAKIQRWNRLFTHHAKRFTAIDPYNVTSRLTKSFLDTEDGMHMGFWVNLHKIQLLLASIDKQTRRQIVNW